MKFRGILFKIISIKKLKIQRVKIATYYVMNILFNAINVKSGFILSAKNVAHIRSLVKLKYFCTYCKEKNNLKKRK